MNVLKRFFKYVSIDTTSDPTKDKNPTSKGQIKLAEMIVGEFKNMRLDDFYFDEENCYVYAYLKGNPDLPSIGFISHLDTSKDAKGKNIKPIIHEKYDGKDIQLNETTILSPEKYPSLKNHVGKTLITTDGTTLLGADDKAGIAEIMAMLDYFTVSHSNRGDIYVCFTPDEEIGMGTDNINYDIFKPDIAYTVDGSRAGELAYENFNAATANIKITGTPSHCGTAKGVMVNAGRIATIFNNLMPNELPENTEMYEGFFHLDEISGNVGEANLKYLIRDFDKDNFEKRKQMIQKITDELNERYGNCIELNIVDKYRNMLEIIQQYPELIERTKTAIEKTGTDVFIKAIRGGTDGTDISFNGIPCPNLGTGGYNYHSVYEYICVEDMERVVEILISIVKKFAKTNKNTLTKK